MGLLNGIDGIQLIGGLVVVVLGLRAVWLVWALLDAMTTFRR
jgi:hypothetical protein